VINHYISLKCCDVFGRRIIGSISFRETITAERYQEMFVNFISFGLTNKAAGFSKMGLEQIANPAMKVLREIFDGRIISRNFWPPRTPNLSVPDFCLWRFLKERV
jgi:hypothetical protein